MGWMTEPLVPSVRGNGKECMRGGVRPEGVEGVVAVTSEELRLGRKILYRETKRVKFHGHIIFTS